MAAVAGRRGGRPYLQTVDIEKPVLLSSSKTGFLLYFSVVTIELFDRNQYDS